MNESTTTTIDPRTLRPGTVVIYKDGKPATLDRRKEDDSGWWCREGGGLADVVLLGGDWTITDRVAGPNPVLDALDEHIAHLKREIERVRVLRRWLANRALSDSHRTETG